MDSEGTGRTLAAQHAHRILGEAGCSQFPEDAPADWVGVQRGRDLFVPGWGGFDIAAALDASGGASASIPSVSELRSIGYLMKYFPDLQDQMIRHKIQQLLRTPETLLARYIVQHHVFWADARNGNRLDEVESHWQDTNVANPSRALKEEPKKLLNRLVRDRAIASHPLIEFAHLVGQPTVFFDDSFFASTLESSFELSVLEESHSVLRAAQELNNCAADYSRNVRQKRCALVVLRSRKKLLAMGEWDLHDRRWCQISEHSDEPVRDEWLKMYKQLETDDFFPIRAVLPLPDLETSTGLLQEVKEDVVSIFSVEGSTSLDRLCSASILGIEPCMGWPCLLDGLEAFHPEASSALLLWSLAAAASSVHSADCELEIVIEKLLCKRADPDTMTDRGWSSLMFAVMVPDPSAIVARLLKAAADVDARAAQSGRTALMLACSIQNFSLVCRLVTFAASLDVAARIDGRTAVIQAVGR
ncbi:Hypothetical protein (Fragment) [Durusdinium trenchii]|uniref:Uncharacterized protein n=1 Tax=Durusdinium trenchii TaxID=1381693 RepID=A0ABP0NHU7_9DINO